MIYICSLAEMPEHVRSLQPSHLVSLLGSAEQPPTPDGFATERHHRVEVNDISLPMDGYVLPQDDHIAGLIRFLDGWDAGAPLLVHCFAGISRSTAAALIALTFRHDGREEEAALSLRRAAPHAQPNRRMIELADTRLGRDGRLIAALGAMGEATLRPYGPLTRVDPLG
jgi:predicted protein tyrosine phosphatase